MGSATRNATGATKCSIGSVCSEKSPPHEKKVGGIFQHGAEIFQNGIDFFKKVAAVLEKVNDFSEKIDVLFQNVSFCTKRQKCAMFCKR